jgi:hypothetical protein
MAGVQLGFAAADIADIKNRMSAPTRSSPADHIRERVLTIMKLFNVKSRRLGTAASLRYPLRASARRSIRDWRLQISNSHLPPVIS